jgi:hypothetical protein
MRFRKKSLTVLRELLSSFFCLSSSRGKEESPAAMALLLRGSTLTL